MNQNYLIKPIIENGVLQQFYAIKKFTPPNMDEYGIGDMEQHKKDFNEYAALQDEASKHPIPFGSEYNDWIEKNWFGDRLLDLKPNGAYVLTTRDVSVEVSIDEIEIIHSHTLDENLWDKTISTAEPKKFSIDESEDELWSEVIAGALHWHLGEIEMNKRIKFGSQVLIDALKRKFTITKK